MTAVDTLLLWCGLLSAVILIVLGPAMLLRPRAFGSRTPPHLRRLLGAAMVLIAVAALVRDAHLIRF